MPKKSSNRQGWGFALDEFGNLQEYEFDPGLLYEVTVMLGPKSRARFITESGDFFFALENVGDEWGCAHSKFRYTEKFAIQVRGQIGEPKFKIVGVDYDRFQP